MPLSEKTLELNVISELTYLFRIAGRNPYYIGYTQFEEFRNATDIALWGGHRIMFLQFKKGHRRKDFFTFFINNNNRCNQHQIFLSRSIIADACRYVFPMIGCNNDAYTHRGRFLTLTPFIPATIIGNLTPPDTSHRIRLMNDGTMTKHSEIEDLGRWTDYVLFEDLSLIDIQRDVANDIINSFQLPTLNDVLPYIREVINDRDSYESIFGLTRSGFCMIFE